MGRINSVQSFGASDGPGLRFVIFTQGCPLRCSCCHNPDTWDVNQGKDEDATNLIEEMLKYRSYYGEEGGITISGGEPLMQMDFVIEIFSLAKSKGIHTCLDTSGCILNKKVEKLLEVTDMVLLDIKYTNEYDYKNHVGSQYQTTLDFLKLLKKKGIATWLRQVAIPTLNMRAENYQILKELKKNHRNVQKIELLPFKKLCISKYENLEIEFPLKEEEEPSKEQLSWAEEKLKGD